ncbi:hypothetical protein FQN50_002015 [Emmonsiellopsis sp. PD_5]|nr:hypothetical protein FQN50_002015 [Emmonsiellopsis sp. PD_5]
MASGGEHRTESPFVIEQDEDSMLDNDLLEGDDETIEADDPLHTTTDRTPLTGNISSTSGPSGQSSSRNPISGSYLTSSIPGEDRRAPQNTIDESVWDTLSRDLLAVWEKMRQVLWPKYLLGGMLARGGGIGAAERGEATGFGNGIGGGVRGLVGRWPDADVVLQGGMSEGLRDWDLWGPLIFCLLLSMFLSIRAQGEQASLVFSGVFCIVWIGEAVVTAQIKLLGGNISFFQSVCIIGYTLFPLVIAAMLSAIGLPTIARIPVYLVLIAWSLAAGVSILGGSGVVKNRVGIAIVCPPPTCLTDTYAVPRTRYGEEVYMAETHQQNGVLDGETAAQRLSEPRSPASHAADPTEKDARGPLSGTQEENPITTQETPVKSLQQPLSDHDDPEGSRTDTSGVTSHPRPTPLEGTRDNIPPPQATQAQEMEEEDVVDSEYLSKTFSDAHDDQGSTHLTPHDNDTASDNDGAELSEGTNQTSQQDLIENPQVSDSAPTDGAGERPVRQKLKETSIAGAARAKSPAANSPYSAHSPQDHIMASQAASVTGADNGSDTSSVEGRGRLRRKRSLEDANADDGAGSGDQDTEQMGHRRKRSRDSKADEDSGLAKSKSMAGYQPDVPGTEAETVLNQGGLRTPTEEVKSAEQDAGNKILSPKKKRSRDQFDKDHLKSDDVGDDADEGKSTVKNGELFDKSKGTSTGSRTVEGEPEKKRHRDNSQDRDAESGSDLSSKKIPPPNPFSNISTVSPFAAITPKPADQTSKGESETKPQITSASAFASSGLAAFAGSENSPFGSLGASASASPFKSALAPESTEAKESAPSSSAFAASPFAAAAPSPFGSFAGGFAGSAFAAAAPKPGGGLTSFAAPTGSAILGSTSMPKVLGQPNDEEGGAEEGNAALGTEEEKGDERFHKQETETGEEGETTLFSCRGKLFHFDGKEWRERGVGTFKVNIKEPENDEDVSPDENAKEPAPTPTPALTGDDDKDQTTEEKEKKPQQPQKKTSRLIMRADGVWRVILNTPIFKGMKAGDPSGAPPSGKQVHFAGFEEGKSVPFLLRTSNEDSAKELHFTIRELQASL